MHEEPMTADELLEQWRDAARAAELAQRLSKIARASVDRADQAAAVAQEITAMADGVATCAEDAARIARAAADRAMALARPPRGRAD